MLYIDKLLSEWAKSGVTTVDDARAQHENRAARPAPSAANPALDYEQRPAAETDYSSRIVDLSQYYKQDGDQS